MKMQNKLQKKAGAFRTIREVAEDFNVEQHVLRFWETKFSQIKPMKRGGGRRYYRPEDIAAIERIHSLLYKEGYTIKGAQKVLKGTTRNQIANENESNDEKPSLSQKQLALLKQTLNNLKDIRENLAKVS